MEIKNNQKGITLIILVVTIVVILILAAITVNIAFQDNGIIKTAESLQNVINNSIATDEEKMAELANKIGEGIIDGGGGVIPDSNNIEEGGGDSGGGESVKPSKPKVELIGKQGETGYYRSEVEIKVTANDRANNLTYIIEGVPEGSITTETPIGNGQSIYITQDGGYTIKVYEYNKNGEKSDPTVITLIRDTVTPTGSLEVIEKGQAEVTVQLIANDPQPSSGLASENPYTFYYKEVGTDTWIEAGKGSASSYTYTGLKENTSYDFKAEIKDKAGNMGTSNEVQVETKNELEVNVTTKHNDTNGDLYEYGTWTNNNLYTEITTDTEKEIEKYQYSLDDGQTWEDISRESGGINTTINFIPGEEKPDWIGDLETDTGMYDYSFVPKQGGGIVSNNKGIDSSYAGSYTKIDLTNYTDKLFMLSINSYISSQIWNDEGKIVLCQDSPFNEENYKMLLETSGNKEETTVEMLEAGHVYYLHFEYNKNGSTSSGDDQFIINSVELNSCIKKENYATNFPMLAGKPEYIGELQHDGEYYFELNGNGGITSNNKETPDSEAYSYIPLDLTNYPEEFFEIQVEASSFGDNEGDIDIYGEENDTWILLGYVDGGDSGTYSAMIQGGELYYLRFYNRTYGEGASMTIEQIQVRRLQPESGGIGFAGYVKENNTIKFTYANSMDENIQYRAVFTDGIVSTPTQNYNVKIDKKVPKIAGIQGPTPEIIKTDDTTTIVIELNEPVDLLNPENIIVNGETGSKIETSINSDGTQITIVVTGGANEGEVSITIPEGTIADKAGSALPETTIDGPTIDNTAPLVVEQNGPTPLGISEGTTSTVILTFNEPVTLQPTGTISITGEGAEGCTIEPTLSEDGLSLTLLVTGGTGEGDITIHLTEGAITEVAGNALEEYTINGIYVTNIAPTVTLKYNDSTGEEYPQGTWTNQNVYVEATMDESREIEKYQYSLDGVTWLDISAEISDTNLNFYNYTKNGNTITFTLQQDVYDILQIRAVYVDNGRVSGSAKGDIKLDKTVPIVESVETISYQTETTGTVQSNVKEEGSGIGSYYLSQENIEPTQESNWITQEENTFSIENIQADTIYYLWIKDKAGNISETREIQITGANYKIDENGYTETLAQAIGVANENSTILLLRNYADESKVNFTKDLIFDTGDYTLTRTKTITINSGKNVTIQGNGTITSGTNNVNTVSNSGNLIVKGSTTIQSQSTLSSYRAIYNYVSTTVQENATIEGYYGIYNTGTAMKTTVEGGIIRGTGTSGDGIYNGTVTVTGGRVEGNRYGIYGGYGSANNLIKIGDETQEVSTTSPVIYGKSQAIGIYSSSYNFAFNSGKLVTGGTTTYNGILIPREGYTEYNYYDYAEQKNATILTLDVSEITIDAEPTTWTNQNVNVTIRYPSTENITKQYSLDEENWIEVNGIRKEISLQENTKVYARMFDSNSILVGEAQKEINYIDKIPPVVTIEPSTTKYTVTDQEPEANITFTISAEDQGGSGVQTQKYAWTAGNETPTYQDFENGIQINKTLPQGTYYLWLEVTDVVGNRAEIEKLRYVVDYLEPVAKIGEVTYTTIQEAIDACADGTNTIITIIKSTDEEVTISEGKDIILDLQGYTIGSSNLNEPIIQNAGTLQIINTSANKTGKLEKLAGTAIQNTGTLTIGDNTSAIQNETPTIYSTYIGIKNEGIFNYYDGSITAKAPIQGNISDTPESYGPVASYEDGMTTVTLGIVADYVARIEYKYYTTLQNAVDACKASENNQNQEEITLLTDIVLNQTVNTYRGQNIKLDFDGYVVSSSTIDKGITNNGSLEITDESTEQTGKLEISGNRTEYGIYNEETGIVRMSRRNG